MPRVAWAAVPGSDASVITGWNETAVAAIVNDGGKSGAETFCWLAFGQGAVYNAVVGITGKDDLYRWKFAGPDDASPPAATAAAHRVLMSYFGHAPATRAPPATPWLAITRPLLLTRHGEEIDWEPPIATLPHPVSAATAQEAGWRSVLNVPLLRGEEAIGGGRRPAGSPRPPDYLGA